MIIENNSDIITSQQQGTLADGGYYEYLSLRDGKVIALTANTIALYKSSDAIGDPLGNGLLASSSFANYPLATNSKPWVSHYRAGFIGLSDDKAILITPMAIQLFQNNQDALNNRNEICRLDLQGIY
jgi:hypothetical protein